MEKPDTYKEEGCCFTHTVGLPFHKGQGKILPLTPYQAEFSELVIRNHDGKKANKYHVNKGRQMGFTEIVLRLIQYMCLHKYANANVGIIAATNGNLAKKDLRRFQALFKYVPFLIDIGLKNNKMELVTGTVIEAFPASEEAMTGDTFYACIFLDEAAKWKNTDDTPIFNSIVPIVIANRADLLLVSTPKGPIKSFYKIHKNPGDYIKLRYDIWESEGNLYSTEEIKAMLAQSSLDVNQEYLTKFTFGTDAVIGEITDEDRDAEVVEWDVGEDDNYVEENLWVPEISA